jgi:hypothetical protein
LFSGRVFQLRPPSAIHSNNPLMYIVQKSIVLSRLSLTKTCQNKEVQMATMVCKASLETAEITDAIVITDMRLESNEHNASTIDLKHSTDETTSKKTNSKVDRLKLADSVFGPQLNGKTTFSRTRPDPAQRQASR